MSGAWAALMDRAVEDGHRISMTVEPSAFGMVRLSCSCGAVTSWGDFRKVRDAIADHLFAERTAPTDVVHA